MSMIFKGFNKPITRVAAALLIAGGLCAAPAAWADATPKDWWVYVDNDRVSDLQALLSQGADPNIRYRNGQPAIMRAVAEGAWKVYDLLAANPKLDLEAQNPAGETVLMYMALLGQTDRARALIARGAKVNRLGWTPLHYAASKGQMEAARLMLQHHAMPNAPSPNGTTPLMMAALSGSRPMVDLLLKAGADPRTQNQEGQDAADWARDAKYNSLADDLTQIAARYRPSAGAKSPQPGMAPATPKPAAKAVPAPSHKAAESAPPAATPSQDSPNAVKGVSGVQLQSYD